MKIVSFFLLITFSMTLAASGEKQGDEEAEKLYSLINDQNEPRDDFLSDRSLSDYSSESNYDTRNVHNDLDNLRLFLIRKKSAPRRIFIGRRSLSSFDSDEESNESSVSSLDKKNPRRHLFLGKRSSHHAKNAASAAAKRHIQRIFIGKRGDIKRIFIG